MSGELIRRDGIPGNLGGRETPGQYNGVGGEVVEASGTDPDSSSEAQPSELPAQIQKNIARLESLMSASDYAAVDAAAMGLPENVQAVLAEVMMLSPMRGPRGIKTMFATAADLACQRLETVEEHEAFDRFMDDVEKRMGG